MSYCPVCKKDYTGDFCIYCGFTESEDVVRYRTVAAVNDLDNPIIKAKSAAAVPQTEIIKKTKGNTAFKKYCIAVGVFLLLGLGMSIGMFSRFQPIAVLLFFIFDIIYRLRVFENKKRTAKVFAFSLIHFIPYYLSVVFYYYLWTQIIFKAAALLYLAFFSLLTFRLNSEVIKNEISSSRILKFWGISSSAFMLLNSAFIITNPLYDEFDDYGMICCYLVLLLAFVLGAFCISFIFKTLSDRESFSLMNFAVPFAFFAIAWVISLLCFISYDLSYALIINNYILYIILVSVSLIAAITVNFIICKKTAFGVNLFNIKAVPEKSSSRSGNE